MEVDLREARRGLIKYGLVGEKEEEGASALNWEQTRKSGFQ